MKRACSSPARRRAASRPSRSKLAERFGATIVNADSMQVYADLRVLTARPSAAETRRAPHRLFGEVDGGGEFLGRPLARARRAKSSPKRAARPLIFVGGTGLYFRALTEGLSDIPRVPEAVRAGGRAPRPRASRRRALHARLAARDPADRRAPAAERPPARAARARSRRRGPQAARRLPWRSPRPPAPARRRLERLVPRRRSAGAQCAHRGALWRHAGRRRARRGRRARRAPARPGAAGDAGPRRTPSRRPSRWRAFRSPKRGRERGQRHPPLHQAPIHLGPPPNARIRLGRAGGSGGGGGGGAEAEACCRQPTAAGNPADPRCRWPARRCGRRECAVASGSGAPRCA